MDADAEWMRKGKRPDSHGRYGNCPGRPGPTTCQLIPTAAAGDRGWARLGPGEPKRGGGDESIPESEGGGFAGGGSSRRAAEVQGRPTAGWFDLPCCLLGRAVLWSRSFGWERADKFSAAATSISRDNGAAEKRGWAGPGRAAQRVVGAGDALRRRGRHATLCDGFRSVHSTGSGSRAADGPPAPGGRPGAGGRGSAGGGGPGAGADGAANPRLWLLGKLQCLLLCARRDAEHRPRSDQYAYQVRHSTF